MRSVIRLLYLKSFTYEKARVLWALASLQVDFCLFNHQDQGHLGHRDHLYHLCPQTHRHPHL